MVACQAPNPMRYYFWRGDPSARGKPHVYPMGAEMPPGSTGYGELTFSFRKRELRDCARELDKRMVLEELIDVLARVGLMGAEIRIEWCMRRHESHECTEVFSRGCSATQAQILSPRSPFRLLPRSSSLLRIAMFRVRHCAPHLLS